MALLTLQNVTKAFGPVTVLENADLVVHPGEKIGLIGANGAGKTTVFRLMTGEISPDIGQVLGARHLRIGYLPQQPELDGSRSVLEEARKACDHVAGLEAELAALSHRIAEHADSREQRKLMNRYDRLRTEFEAAGGYDYHVQIGELLGGLGFSPSDYESGVASLSGGQKCRLTLAKLLLNRADLLLLDEPTNHLDIPGREALERALAAFDGSVLVVSHDRYFLDRVVQRLIVLERGSYRIYEGNYSYYAAMLETEARRRAEARAAAKAAPQPARTPPRKRAGAARPPADPYADLSLAQLEEQINCKDARVRQIETLVAAPDFYRDHQRARELTEEYKSLRAEIETITAAWMQRAEKSG